RPSPRCLRSSAGERRVSAPGPRWFESSRGLHDTTPWPSGRHASAKRAHGGSNPPGVFPSTTRKEEAMSKVKTFGDVDARSLEQLERCMAAGDAEFGVLCADHHPGYSQPIGGGIAYEGYVSPSGVGFDIACGVKGAQTEL